MASDVARPMPEAPPVTSATLRSRIPAIVLSPERAIYCLRRAYINAPPAPHRSDGVAYAAASWEAAASGCADESLVDLDGLGVDQAAGGFAPGRQRLAAGMNDRPIGRDVFILADQ